MTTLTRAQFRDALVLENGQTFGQAASPEQRAFVAALDAGRKHAFWLAPRGTGKTLLCAMEAVTELFLGRPGTRIDSIAVDLAQAQLLLDSAIGLITHTPHLLGSVVITRTQIRVPATGSVLEVLPSDGPSMFGRSPHVVVCDELFQMETAGRDAFLAAYTSLPKTGGRLIVITTPGPEQSGWCWRLLQIAKTSPDRWTFMHTETNPSWVSEEQLAEAREFLPASVYQRYHGAQFSDPEGALFDTATVERVFRDELEPALGGVGAVGVDLALSRDYACASRVKMVGRARRFIVEEVRVWRASRTGPIDLQEIQNVLPLMRRGYASDIPYYMDAWQAALMAQQLRRAGLNVVEVPFTKPARDELYQTLLRAVQTGKLECLRHEQFRAELLGLRVEQTPTGFRVDHRRNAHDDICIATTLALVGLQRLLENSFVYAGRGVDGKAVVADPFAHTELTPLQRRIFSQGGE